ncbi:MAG: hypothetical protein GXP26_16870 [Planctomycetes bacterium]|nr:hypothetical protein [Planctomycetota bacterium]
MNSTLYAQNLLAQFSNWERLGDGLHGSRGRANLVEVLPYLIGLALVAAIIFAVVKYIKYNDLSKPCDDPQKLFREISKAHGLDRSSQRLLRQLADALGYVQPAEVFVTPSAFEANQLPEELRDEEARIRELRERLF